MNVPLAWAIVGGLSEPSKMPCYGFSLSAKKCKTGQKLRRVKGSICSKCYALRGRYLFENVRNALERRLAGLNHPQWVEALACLINSLESSGYFRWFDSGDIQSLEHLRKIVEVCKLTPTIKHWLPTREYGFVAQYIRENGAFPSNLVVRLSAYLVGGPPPACAKILGLPTSGVVKQDYSCPAPKQGGKCLLCRACWNKKTSHVTYKSH